MSRQKRPVLRIDVGSHPDLPLLQRFHKLVGKGMSAMKAVAYLSDSEGVGIRTVQLRLEKAQRHVIDLLSRRREGRNPETAAGDE